MNNRKASGVEFTMRRTAMVVGSIFFGIEVLTLFLVLLSGFAFPHLTGLLLAVFVNCGILTIAFLLASLDKKK